jgi:alkanesulfonate monooxygenase SsuD/methylene tetrahydromethanopterin reductase-like flavin-dependent oxidoreductase (luciferase family)
MARLAGSLAALRAYHGTLSEEEWNARGTHPRLGEMTVARIMDRFIVGHLEEHADQLATLAAASA